MAKLFMRNLSWANWVSIPSLKLTANALKMVVSNRNLLFQGTIFRCYVGLREGNLTGICSEFRSNMTIEPCSFVFIHFYPYSSMFNGNKKHLWQKVDVFQPAMFTSKGSLELGETSFNAWWTFELQTKVSIDDETSIYRLWPVNLPPPNVPTPEIRPS